MSIRIGLDATPLLGQRSGVGNYTSRLLGGLLATVPEAEYLLYSNKVLEPLEPALAGAIPIYSRWSLKRVLWMQLLLPQIIRQTEPDLCHFPNSMAPLSSSRPFVLTIHDASLFVYGQYHPTARILSMRFLLPLLAQRAAAVITVSHHARQALVDVLDLDPRKVHVVHEAAPRDFHPVTDPLVLADLRRRYELPEEFLLHVGTLEPRKNLLRLVRALARLREDGFSHKLVLVGSAGWQMDDFDREIEHHSLQHDVQRIGYVPTEDLPGIYSLARLFVFPSLYEGFGLPPLEAMACGTPVLSSNRAALPEVLGDAALLFDPEDDEALFDSLVRLLSDPHLLDELSWRGLRRAQSFSWERAARETLAIYSQVSGVVSAGLRQAVPG